MRNKLPAFLSLPLFAVALGAQDKPVPPSPDIPWPHQIKAGSTTLTVYQPQIDSWDGHELEARAAVSASQGEGEKAKSTYGIVHVTARVHQVRRSRAGSEMAELVFRTTLLEARRCEC